MTNRYIIGMFYDAAYLSRQLIARIIEPLAVLELCGQFYAYNKYATLSLQTLVLWDFSVQQALIDCSGYIKRFTNPGKCEGLVRMFLRFRFCGIVCYVLYRFSFPQSDLRMVEYSDMVIDNFNFL